MSWGMPGGRIVARRWLLYPVALLLVVVGPAGCAGERRIGPPIQNLPATGLAAPAGTTTAAPTPTALTPPTPSPAAPTSATTSAAARYVFPVSAQASYHPSHSGYPATDVFARCGAPVVAVTDGTILEVSRIDRFDPDGPNGPFNGGRFVSLLGDDGVRYYGSHLTEVADGVDAGVRVRAGQRVGSVGRSGNASNVCHLHFGISPPCQQTDDWWIRRGVVGPAPFLDAWRKKISKAPVATVAAWHREHGCPKAP